MRDVASIELQQHVRPLSPAHSCVSNSNGALRGSKLRDLLFVGISHNVHDSLFIGECNRQLCRFYWKSTLSTIA